MCKCINPCCCISSGIASMNIAVADIVLGLLTLGFSAHAIYNFKDLRGYLKEENIEEDVAWFGIISIPFFAVIGVWSGFKLLCSLASKSKESNHILKFVIFFLVEVIGFAAPFLIVQDYGSKIEKIKNYSTNNFVIFVLLEVNVITIGLFIYQIVSFWVVHRHHRITEDKKNAIRCKPRRGPTALSTLQSIVERSPSGIASSSTTIRTIAPGSMYPNLKDFELDVLPSPMYSVPHDCVIHLYDTDSDCDEPSNLKQYNFKAANKKSVFEVLKNNCLKKGRLYVDEEFPANNRSLGSGRSMEWKRPHEIAKNAKFFVNGISRFDVKQGTLGDCWFLAAVANLTLNKQIFYQVVPRDNEWAKEGEDDCYAGIFHFRFNVNDEWKEIIIDDLLPTINGELVYLHSSDRNEFWSPLLEKAYAKLNGSYNSLNGNDGMKRAMENLTGGQVQRYKLPEFRYNLEELFQILDQALNKGKMLGCCTSNDGRGIVGGHAYSITHVRKIVLKDGNAVPALRIRNPWGDETEWTGEFSDGHRIWTLVDKRIQRELMLIFKHDGEFWFPIKELTDYFQFVEVCHLP